MNRTAHRLTALLLPAIALAAVCVLLSPIDAAAVEPHRLSGRVLEWRWVRAFSPFINLYAFVFLVGGAVLSAVRFARLPDQRHRAAGNVLIAVGALLMVLVGFGPFGAAVVAGLVYFVALPVWSRVVEGPRKATDRLMSALIWSAFVIALVPLVTLVWTVLKNGLPAISVDFGEDNPAQELTGGYFDSLLSCQITAIVARPEEQDVRTELLDLRRQIHKAIAADRTLGLSFVVNTHYGGTDAPEIDVTGDVVVGALMSAWNVYYRMNIADPGD